MPGIYKEDTMPNALGFAVANMDPSVNPTNDFYRFAAGGWLDQTDPHPPSAVRATGPLVNLDAFYAAFAIQPGDAMWRDKNDRVEIW